MSEFTYDEEDYEEDYEMYSEDDEDEYIYDIEDTTNTRFSIILCELYNTLIHGITDTNVIQHYLVISRFKLFNINFINYFKNNYILNLNHNTHTNIYNEIAECIYLPTQECVAIIKTMWLRLIQRTWKKIFNSKQNMLKQRCIPSSIRYREIHGIWPLKCRCLPTLKGMLSYLL